MDFFSSSSSGAGASQKKKSKAPSSVVVSTIKRAPSTSTQRPHTSSIQSASSRPRPPPAGAGATNALPPQVRARIEAAREAERQKKQAEAEAARPAKAASTTSSASSSSKSKAKKSKAALDDFIDSDEEDAASGKKRSSKKKRRATSSALSDPGDDDLFGDGRSSSPGSSSSKARTRGTPSTAAASRKGTPSSTSAYTYLGRAGVSQPYLVPRDALFEDGDATRPSPPSPLISSAKLVTAAMAKKPRGWGPFFKDLEFDGPDGPPRCTLQYPGSADASEDFILMVPRDSDEYDPISDLLRSVYVTVKYYLTDEQREQFGELDELEMSSAAGHICADPIRPGGASSLGVPPMSPSSGAASPITSSPPSRGGLDTAPATTTSILRSFTKSRNRRSGALFLSTVARYNSLLSTFRATGSLRHNIRSFVSTHGIPDDVWMRIQDQAYARTVAPRVDELAQYQSFSDNVYGELTPKFMSEISQLCGLRPGKKMLDLGCGVGNLVVQAALQSGCSSLGIEAMPVPAELGVLQLEEARKRWTYVWELAAFVPDSEGREGAAAAAASADADAPLPTPAVTRPLARVWQGDFINDESLRAHLADADLLIVNNYAFTPPLNQSLSLLFLDLKDGAQIISLKPFVPADFRLSERTLGSSSAILRVEERDYGRGMVSWTERGGKYYIATVDRTALKAFYEGGTVSAFASSPSGRKRRKELAE